MGIDFLDLTFRLEKEFEVKLKFQPELLTGGSEHHTATRRFDVRVADLVRALELQIAEQTGGVPEDVFERTRLHIVDCLCVKLAEVVPEAWLTRDLGMS